MAWWFLAQWLNAGASIPFTVEDAANHLGIKVEETLQVLDEALGGRSAEWHVGPQVVVPRQGCLLAHQSLARLKASYDGAQDSQGARQAATVAYAAVEEQDRKRRRGAE